MPTYKVVDTDKLDADLKIVADSIRAKSGETSELLFPGGFKDAVSGIKTGSASDEAIVTFYDYDGTVLYTYSLDEVKAMSELPPLPTQPGLICQGWNWDLETIKTYDRDVNVGATYITDDGKTRIYITLQEGRTSPMLGVAVNGTVTVDWGDGSEPDVLSGSGFEEKYTPKHAYPDRGDYVICLTVDGNINFIGNDTRSLILVHSDSESPIDRMYRACIKKLEIGNGVGIGPYAFYECYSLSSITISEDSSSIGDYAFNGCYSLSSVTIPKEMSSIGARAFAECHALKSAVLSTSLSSIGQYAFYRCYSLISITLPQKVVSVASYTFYECVSLMLVTISEGVSIIDSYAFGECCSLLSVVIPKGTTRINSSAFKNCYSLSSVIIPEGVTRFQDNVFYGCRSLTSIALPKGPSSTESSLFNLCTNLVSVTLPTGLITIQSGTFYSCRSLESIVLPETVKYIYANAFYGCYLLTHIVFPKSVNTISKTAFSSCSGMRCYDFSSHEKVPTLENTNAFSGIPADCEIRVPAALYDEWIAATNWTTYASYIVPV